MNKSNVKSHKIIFVVYAALFLTLFIYMDANPSRNDPDTFWHIEVGKEMIKQGKVIDTAIHTFAGENLSYVPHEVVFQWIVGGLYNLGEWKYVHLLTLMSVFILTWGLYRLMEISRKEMGLAPMHPFLVYIMLPFFTFYIYLTYFNIRPQIISAGLVVWFVVWLRRYAMNPTVKKAGILGILSFILANVHTGVWAVIFVLLVMQVLERIYEKKLNRHDLFAVIFVIVGGIANFGGWKSLTYFLTLTNSPFTEWIDEWKPISFSKSYFTFMNVLLFILTAMYSIKKPFRLMLFIGMLFLGLANYKQHLFLILFLPYYMAVIVDRFKWLGAFRILEPFTRMKYVITLLVMGLVINFGGEMFTAYKTPMKDYPVEEMNYILQTNNSTAVRPKVLSTYGTSGYVMFRGGDVLADGRFDPFILESTKGVHGWTAVERSINGFKSRRLLDVIQSDRPDFLILPVPEEKNKKDTVNTLKAVELDEVKQQLGKPDFTGSFGQVWDLRKDRQ